MAARYTTGLAVCLALALGTAPAARSAGRAVADSAARADRAAAPDSSERWRHRVVLLRPYTVSGERRVDPGSLQSVHTLDAEQVRTLPVDGFTSLVATRAGVVASGSDLHVRGGRAGELAVEMAGLPLNDALDGRPFELPMGAVESADLLLGGIDAEHAGTLAGALDVRTRVPGSRWTGQAAWAGDGRRGTGFDAVRLRGDGPLRGTPLALAVAGDATFDDLGLPVLRSRGRSRVLGTRWGWRADNRLLAWARLSPRAAPRSASLQVFAGRRVEQPYDPMFSFDGWRHPCPDSTCYDPFTPGVYGPDDSTRYRAADHAVMTETRDLAAIATLTRTLAKGWWRVSLGLQHRSQLTSVGLSPDDDYIRAGNRAAFGSANSPYTDPFYVYDGDEPYFRRTRSTRAMASADLSREWKPQQRSQAGLGFARDRVQLREHDDAEPRVLGIDRVREFTARAPSGWAYAQHRWERAGLVFNAGLRAQWFSAGPDAAPRPADTWTFSPRLGFAYPMTDRDAFSVSYVRLHQPPARQYLYESRISAWGRRPLGNPDLQPAEVLSYQAALQHRFDDARTLQLALFYRDVYGLVGVRDTLVAGGLSRPRYQDTDDAHAGGFEVAFTWARNAARAEVAYTYLNAWGIQSREDGTAYRPAAGRYTHPAGDHPLDWDQRHTLALTASGRPRGWLGVSWITRTASARPWTPVVGFHEAFDAGQLQPYYPILLNSKRLQWSETTDLSVRATWPPRRGLTWTLDVRNLFGSRHATLATLGGYPGAVINSLYDEYGAYRTDTGHGGGAYWDAPDSDGRYRWVPVNDPRLVHAPRSVRLGVELAL